MDTISSKIYIRDLALAAALVTRGFENIFSSMDTEDSMVFAFNDTNEIRRHMASFKKDVLYVKAQGYSDNIKKLRSQAHADRYGL